MKLSRTFFTLSLTLLVTLLQMQHCASAESSASSTQWVSLSAWANNNNFKLTWFKKDESFTLTNKSFRLVFKADSQRAEINGINVWLSDPITLWGGQARISSLDLKASVEPILSPQTNDVGGTIRTICLDPGHGGKDTGGRVGKYLEKRYTLLLAQELEKRLRAAGFKVILTRMSDKFVKLDDRPELANRVKADLFMSLHFDVAPEGEASGVEVYCLTPANASSTNAKGKGADTPSLPGNRQDAQNVLLAYQLQRSLVENLRADDRGLRRARFAVLRPTDMPAVLIEGGFLSDSEERVKIADPKYRSQIAEAIVQGLLAYKRIGEL